MFRGLRLRFVKIGGFKKEFMKKDKLFMKKNKLFIGKDKLFRETFGVEPFTEEEINEIKAALFDAGSSPHVYGNVNMYARYYKFSERRRQIEDEQRTEDEGWEELASFAH